MRRRAAVISRGAASLGLETKPLSNLHQHTVFFGQGNFGSSMGMELGRDQPGAALRRNRHRLFEMESPGRAYALP